MQLNDPLAKPGFFGFLVNDTKVSPSFEPSKEFAVPEGVHPATVNPQARIGFLRREEAVLHEAMSAPSGSAERAKFAEAYFNLRAMREVAIDNSATPGRGNAAIRTVLFNSALAAKEVADKEAASFAALDATAARAEAAKAAAKAK